MKSHTSAFKEEIKNLGRQLNNLVIYGTTTLNEELFSVNLNYEANILKSAMKQLTIESSTDIPINTAITYRLGLLVNGAYEYIDYGNFTSVSSEKEEDKDLYRIICYDKMIQAMKPYQGVDQLFPMTVRQYLIAICNKIGLPFANEETSFANYNRTIAADPYLELGYTYRDVLDELAQVTASTICINDNDELEIRYITNTNDVIDEEYLKDTNVNFSEKYGKINSIVLSRAGGSDNVYIDDEESIRINGLCELKIMDNQIMNYNDRSDYLPDILEKLDGLEFYINDLSSTGVLYYDLCDRYEIKIGEQIYSCVMFNDEINVTTGLEEFIYTDMPEQSETDYTKADKTDRRINQTYIIVDKQNQKIESVVNEVTAQNNKISQVTQTVDELNSKISDIADITIAGESNYALVELDDINQSEPIMVKVHPILENISYLYPRSNLFPSTITYLPGRTIRFVRTYEETNQETGVTTTKTENIDYILPDDLLWYDNETYDEFYLNYESQTCQVIKRCAYNADGTVRKLIREVVTDYDYPTIVLGDGDYQIKVMGYDTAYLSVRLMAQNMYTTQFATKTEMTSAIEQKANSIMLEVNEKVNEDEIIAQLNVAIQEGQGIVRLIGNQVIIDSDNFKLLSDGSMQANNGTFNGDVVIDASNTLKVKKDANKNLMEIGSNGQSFYNDDSSVAGAIGTTYVNTSTYGTLKGLQFCLDREGFFMGWFSRYRAGNDFTHKLMYAKAMSGIFPENDQNIEGLFAGCHLFMKGYRLFTNGSGGINIVQNMLQTGDDNLDFFVQTNLRVTKDLYVYGHIYGTIASDRRLKQNIKDSEINAIELIKQIKHRQFEWKEDGRHEENGYIAQEMEEIHKNFVEKVPIATPDGKVTDYKYCISESFTLATATKAIQEQQKEIEELKKEIRELKEMIKNGIQSN